jgi:mannitol/fructose-specific phosphotransferase system IIA component (Ntr-type)
MKYIISYKNVRCQVEAESRYHAVDIAYRALLEKGFIADRRKIKAWPYKEKAYAN